MIGQVFNIGDLVFGDGEMGYIARKIISNEKLIFKIRLTSQTECLILVCSGDELIKHLKEGVWTCRSGW